MKPHLHWPVRVEGRGRAYPYIYQRCRCGARRTRNPNRARTPAPWAGWPPPVDEHGRAIKSTGWVPEEVGS